ncbi:uncharacterized protein B0I36DRAFT_250557 [Microdochium trichocladiopsis]|uniref:TauD/TfdA-like domain-containing protein n=1 Tax=Microdochium trichocladiopsis TaxID=1682393 RepID=A0A9P8XYJ2_9PEZI|nr:uncharacterized protein B0I36DRAFT_250557 [Microdochium trichocladiopsis]KAH7024919.1 hypothetical protein B0I36DRAFT_250557 [Microdochium trichocladiopsis]
MATTTITSSGDGAADKSIFPDGYKTSGQHAPVPERVHPFEAYPEEITGPTVWQADEYRNNPEKWTHSFTDDEIREIEQATDRFIESGVPLTAITKEHFALPTLGPFLGTLRYKTLINGPGFFLFKNLPVHTTHPHWTLHKSATAYMGLGAHLGYPVSQNSRGHVLGHVKDLGEDPTKTDRVRIYRTNARQFFHTDATDLVGLLCIAKAMEGGESDIISTHHVWNILRRDHPDVARTLTEDKWFFDRKGEVSKGEGQWYRGCVFYLENDELADGGNRRVYLRFDPNNVTSLSRFNSGPDAQIPPLSEAQLHAIKTLEETCLANSLHMVLDPGDIQLLANSHVLHARTAYKDYEPGTVDPETGRERPRRHLMRLWLATPEDDGGWKLPYPDSGWKKRGGIQVDDNAPACPLDAE